MAVRTAKRTRRLWIAADVAAVTLIGGGLWWRWLNATPVVNIPAPLPLPSPNAFDAFVRASSLIVDEAVIDSVSGKTDYLPKERNGVPYSDAEKAAAVAHNAPALVTLRSGFSEQYRSPTRRGFNALFPELAKFRALARLLSAEGEVREANGNFGGAAESRLDAMQLGATVPRGSNLIGALVGIACEAIGRRPLWSLAGKLTGHEAHAVAKRLEEIETKRVPLADSLTEEKWFAEVGLLQEFRKKNTFQLCQTLTLVAPAGDESPLGTKQLASLAFNSIRTSKTQVIQNHAAFMDDVIAQERLPYQAAYTVILPSVPDDPINAALLPVFGGASIKEADVQMEDSLLTAVFALRAYQAEHDSYPENLNALVSGGYLSRVPADPFSMTGDTPLQYSRLENGKYLLYSIGPDGRDDNGTPIQATFANGKSKTWVEADMQGDFVVGVNNIRTEKTPGS